MRHKEHTAPDRLDLAPPPRSSLYQVAHFLDLDSSLRDSYSAMKYGAGDAVDLWATQMADLIQGDARIADLHRRLGRIYMASSAYGSVPTAATTLVAMAAARLRANGWTVQLIRIAREGGFETTNYGRLGPEARQKAMRRRRLKLPVETVSEVDGECLVVLDDLRCTGAHEQAIHSLFASKATLAAIHFAYCIVFEGDFAAKTEDALNHSRVKALGDLLPFYLHGPEFPYVNARMLKFILLQSPVALRQFFGNIGVGQCLRLYHAALGEDGYFEKPRFRVGFQALEGWLMEENGIERRMAFGARNRREGKVVGWNLAEDAHRGFICAETGKSLQEEVALYSRFKFGDVEAIQAIGKRVAGRVVQDLEAGGQLRAVFERAREAGEFVSLTAPGVRNVVSASNFLAREVGLRVNVWLTQQGLPTMVIRTLGRLSSGRDNYAELSARQRASRNKTTQTLLPRSEYQDFPSHVIFLDDVEVTGQTANRAKSGSLQAGALTFHQILAFRVDPALALADASVEHRMNHFAVGQQPDATIAKILGHPDYLPVQRMLRLLLHPDNVAGWVGLIEGGVASTVLIRLYLAAMANDYLWIKGPSATEVGIYAPSVELLRTCLVNRGLLDAQGLPY